MPPTAPRPTAPPSPAQQQKEAARLLMRLDEMLRSVRELSARTCEEVSVGGLNRYRRFAKRVRDFFALAAVTEERLYAAPELAGSALMTALDHLHARMLVLFVETSSAFFKLYIRVREVPIGTNEICSLELRGLSAIAEFLDDPRYEGARGRALREEAERIAEMMRFVIDRVPPLEDFGALPSIGPKGELRRPVKAPPRRPPQPQAASVPPVYRPAPPSPPPPPPEPDIPATPFVPGESWEDEPGP
jgi:hypothetical protein